MEYYIIYQLTNLDVTPQARQVFISAFNKSVLKSTDRSDFHKANISKLNNFEDYRRNRAVKFGQQRYEQIKQSLQTEDLAQKNYEKRIKNHDHYLLYKKNPFLINQNDLQSSLANDTPRQNRENVSSNLENPPIHKKRYDNILEGLSNLKLKLEKSNIKTVISKTERKIQEINHKVNISQKKVNFEALHKVQKSPIKIETSDFDAKLVSSQSETAYEPFQELQNIVQIKQVNFYQKRNSKTDINLFHLLFQRQNERLLKRGPKFLQKYKFCQDSLIKQKQSSFNVFSGDHISTKQRQQALSKPNQSKISKDEIQDELDINLQKVKFEDLLNVACAKIDSQKVRNYLIGLREISLLKREQEIVYRQQQQSQFTNKDSEAINQEAQVVYLRGQQRTSLEARQHQLSDYYRKKLEKLLQKQRSTTIKYNIRDVRVVTSIEDQKSKIINQQMDTILNKQQNEEDTQKLIRMNKRKKDHCVNIRNSVVLSTLINKRVYENANKSRSQSKGKMLNWR